MSARPSRRRFLLLACSAITAAGGALCLRWRNGDNRARADISTMLGERRAAIAIGEEYLRQYPEERNAGELLRRITGAGFWRVSPSRDEIAARVRGDFTSGSTVHIRGWLLSRTEARLCALVALE